MLLNIYAALITFCLGLPRQVTFLNEQYDDHFVTVAGETNSLAVLVSDVGSVPQLTVTLNGQDRTTDFDIMQVTRKIRCRPFSFNKDDCPLHYDLDILYNATTFTAVASDDGSMLQIAVSLPEPSQLQSVLVLSVEVLCKYIMYCE